MLSTHCFDRMHVLFLLTIDACMAACTLCKDEYEIMRYQSQQERWVHACFLLGYGPCGVLRLWLHVFLRQRRDVLAAIASASGSSNGVELVK